MATKKRWLSDRSKCDLCNADISVGKVKYFVDGKVNTCGGAWALMCPSCHDLYGVGLGLGIGQKYDGMSTIPYLLEGDEALKR